MNRETVIVPDKKDRISKIREKSPVAYGKVFTMYIAIK